MKIILRSIFLLISILSIFCEVYAQDALLKDSGWNFHFQFTGIIQYNPSFQSPYSGQNSFSSKSARAYSVTTTAFIGRKLWPGASLYFNPEMAGGEGLSGTLGIAGFPNGETFRIGDPKTLVYVARLFLRQQIDLDKAHLVTLDEGMNQVKEMVSTKRITIN